MRRGGLADRAVRRKSRAKRIIGEGLTEYQRVTNATLVAFGVVAIFCYLAQIEFARGYVALALPLGWALLLCNRLAWRRILLRMRRDGRCLTGAIVVGSALDVERTVNELRRNVRAGYRSIAVAIFDRLEDASPATQGPSPVFLRSPSTTSWMPRRIRALGHSSWPATCRRPRPHPRDGLAARELARRTDPGLAADGCRRPARASPPRRGSADGPRQLPQYTGVAHTVKRGFDVFASAVALLVLSPLLGAIALPSG